MNTWGWFASLEWERFVRANMADNDLDGWIALRLCWSEYDAWIETVSWEGWKDDPRNA